MSYEKLTGPPKKIRFYYITDDVFNRVSRITSFKATSTKNEEGNADFDKLQITDDEKNQFRDYLKEGMLEVFSGCFKIIASDSITHDASIALVAPLGTVTASHVQITDNEQYRTINLDLIDNKISNALVHYILSEWYFLKGIPEATQLHLLKYRELFNKINDLTLPLRQPSA